MIKNMNQFSQKFNHSKKVELSIKAMYMSINWMIIHNSNRYFLTIDFCLKKKLAFKIMMQCSKYHIATGHIPIIM